MTKADLARVLSDENLGEAWAAGLKAWHRGTRFRSLDEKKADELVATRARLIELAEAQGLVADVPASTVVDDAEAR